MVLANELLPQRNCATCNDRNKKQWGCEKKAALPLVWNGENIWRCPLRPYYEDPVSYHDLFEAKYWIDKGFLPEPGTWKDQPARLIDFLITMEQARGEAQRQKNEQAAADAGKR